VTVFVEVLLFAVPQASVSHCREFHHEQRDGDDSTPAQNNLGLGTARPV
jgi:hypothetical protein